MCRKLLTVGTSSGERDAISICHGAVVSIDRLAHFHQEGNQHVSPILRLCMEQSGETDFGCHVPRGRYMSTLHDRAKGVCAVRVHQTQSTKHALSRWLLRKRTTVTLDESVLFWHTFLCTYRANTFQNNMQRSLSHGLPKTAKHKPPPRAERRDTARAPRIQRLCACGLITSTSKISYTNTRLLTSPIEGHQECGQTTPRNNCENR